MQTEERKNKYYLRELRLFIEEICCNLCRFYHVDKEGVSPEDVKIHQQVYLGVPGSYADILVQVPGSPPYIMEVEYGYPADDIRGPREGKEKEGV